MLQNRKKKWKQIWNRFMKRNHVKLFYFYISSSRSSITKPRKKNATFLLQLLGARTVFILSTISKAVKIGSWKYLVWEKCKKKKAQVSCSRYKFPVINIFIKKNGNSKFNIDYACDNINISISETEINQDAYWPLISNFVGYISITKV